MKATKKYLFLVAACATMAVSAVAFTACGDSHTHTLTKTDAVDATCTTDGAEAYWTCSDCEKMFSDAEAKHEIKAVVVIPAGHKLDKTDEVSATCTEAGTEAYWTCSACDKWFNDAEGKNENEDKTPVAIPANGHKLTKTDEVPATCEEDGTAAYWTCSDCKKKFSDAEGKNVIEAPTPIPATGHDWDETEYVQTATTHYCVCKNDPTHHNEANHDEDADFKCTVCGYQHEHTWSSYDYTDTGSEGHYQLCYTGVEIHKGSVESHDTNGANGTCSKCGYKERAANVTLTYSEGTVTIPSLDSYGTTLIIEGCTGGKRYKLSSENAKVTFAGGWGNPYTFDYSEYYEYYYGYMTVPVCSNDGSTLTDVVITIEEVEVQAPGDTTITVDQEVTVSGTDGFNPVEYTIELESGYYQIIINGNDYDLLIGNEFEDGDLVAIYTDGQNRYTIAEADTYYIWVYSDMKFKVTKVGEYEGGGNTDPEGTENNPITVTLGDTVSVNLADLGVGNIWFRFESAEGGTFTITTSDTSEDSQEWLNIHSDPSRPSIAYGTNITITLEAGDIIYINAMQWDNANFTFTITAGGEAAE